MARAMNSQFVFDFNRVFTFCHPLLPGLDPSPGMRAIGWERDGQVVAGVLLERINAHNAWVHVALKSDGRPLPRRFVEACFQYPFRVYKVQRLSGYVDASNLAARRFDEHLGFKEEARLKGAAQDGGDVILYVMWREGCRYV